MQKTIKFIFVIAVVLLFVVATAGCVSNSTTTAGTQSVATTTSTPIPTQATPKDVTGYVGDTMESYVSGDHISWSISKVIRGSQANNIVAEGNMFNSKPSEGYEYILYEVTVGNLGTEKYSIYPSTWQLYVNGVEVGSSYAVLPSNYNSLSYVDIRGGAKTSGWIVKEIPIGSDARVYFEPMFSFTTNAEDCFIYL